MPKLDRNPAEQHDRGHNRSWNVVILIGFYEDRRDRKDAAGTRRPEKTGAAICKREQPHRFNQRTGVFFLGELMTGSAKQANHFETIIEVKLLSTLEEDECALSLAGALRHKCRELVDEAGVSGVVGGDIAEDFDHLCQTIRGKLP